jgi:hypothetical protein
VENCPALYRVVGGPGGYVVQGRQVPTAVLAKLRQLGIDENAVWVQDDVIDGPGQTG